MGFGSDIDMSKSNASQKARYNQYPSIANTLSSTPAPVAMDPDAPWAAGDAANSVPPLSVAKSVTAGPRETTIDPASATGAGFGNNDRGTDTPPPAMTNPASGSATVPNHYTAPGPIAAAVTQGLPAGSGVPQGMTTEQSNAYYAPINAAMTAKTEQDQQQNRAVADAQSNASIAIERSRQADLRAQRTPGAAGSGSQAAAEKAASVAAAADTALSGARTGRDYTKEAQGSQDLIQKAREAQLNEAGKAQGLVSGQQGIKKGELELKHADLVQSLGERLAQAPKDSPEYATLMGLYRTMIGKDGEEYDTKVVPGGTRFDPANPTVPIKDPDRIVTQRRGSGEPPHEVVLGPASTAASAPPPEWMAAAKKANPGMSEQQLAAQYKPR